VGILKVARIGHPVLRSLAKTVSASAIQSDEVQRLIEDMRETMHEYDGVGLAAPQVHVGLKIAVIEVSATDHRADDGVPFMVLINPVVRPLSAKSQEGWEGCLSIPDLRGSVPRPARVRLKALDAKGRPYTLDASDFFARVIQHECDHLEGRVYLDRMPDMRTLAFLREFERFEAGED
jgi:peptide deformylase